MKRTWAASKNNIKKLKNNKHRNILTLKSTPSLSSERKQLTIWENMKSAMLINHCRKHRENEMNSLNGNPLYKFRPRLLKRIFCFAKIQKIFIKATHEPPPVPKYDSKKLKIWSTNLTRSLFCIKIQKLSNEFRIMNRTNESLVRAEMTHTHTQ